MRRACQGEKKTAQRRKGLPVRVLRIERQKKSTTNQERKVFCLWQNSRLWAEPDSRIFTLTKHTLKRGVAFGCKASGVKVIRIHDLRHSHVSLLINMGYSAVAIGNRVGHESVEITCRYAHLFPTVQKEMADKLNVERGN